MRITAKLLDIEYNEININAKSADPAVEQASKKKDKNAAGDKKEEQVNPLLAKSLTGKFPVLETPEGFTIFVATSIAKYFARQRKGFYGNNDFESKSHSIQFDCSFID